MTAAATYEKRRRDYLKVVYAEFEVEDSEAKKRAGSGFRNVSATAKEALLNLAERNHQPKTRLRLNIETESARANQYLHSSLTNYC